MNYLLVHCEIVPVVQQLANQKYQMKEMVLTVICGQRRHLASIDAAFRVQQTLRCHHPGRCKDTHHQTPSPMPHPHC